MHWKASFGYVGVSSLNLLFRSSAFTLNEYTHFVKQTNKKKDDNEQMRCFKPIRIIRCYWNSVVDRDKEFKRVHCKEYTKKRIDKRRKKSVEFLINREIGFLFINDGNTFIDNNYNEQKKIWNWFFQPPHTHAQIHIHDHLFSLFTYYLSQLIIIDDVQVKIISIKQFIFTLHW